MSICLSAICLLLLLSIYLQLFKQRTKLAMSLLVVCAFLFRLLLASADPFLHDWDERFHALVAKNMIEHPLRPMLRVHSLLPFEIANWSGNNIWLHKQPFFLWQMAFSMKLFGVSAFTMRLPSVIMGTLSVYLCFDFAKVWTKRVDLAYIAALLLTVSFYQLELGSGRLRLDQNDIAFAFYVGTSIWGFSRLIHSKQKFSWSVFIGVVVGLAVLTKWLTGLLVFSAWGFYLLSQKRGKFNWYNWKYIFIAAFVSLVVFVPWQLYIMQEFPLESSISYAHNRRHIFEELEGHGGSVWYYLVRLRSHYGLLSYGLIPLGLFTMMRNVNLEKRFTYSLLGMVLVLFSFFSLIVKTKMAAFTFPVHMVFWTIMAFGLHRLLSARVFVRRKSLLLALVFSVAIITLQPWKIVSYRSQENDSRNRKIANTQVYKSLNASNELPGRVILNCNPFEDVELMFHQNVTAYSWYPSEEILDSLHVQGYKFAAFTNAQTSKLPDYIFENKEIVFINTVLK